MLAVAATVLGLGSLGAVLAPNLAGLVGARVVQGAGAGAIPTLSMVLLAHRFAGPARARALGIQIAGVGLGHAVGPLAGGVLVDIVGWRGAVAVGLLVLPTVPLLARMGSPRTERVSLDPAGTALLAVFVVGLVASVNRGLRSGDVALMVSLGIGLAVVGTMLWWHVRRHPNGILLQRVVGTREFIVTALQGGLGQAGFLLLITALPLVFGQTRNLTGIRLGLILVPMAAAVAVTSPRHGLVSEAIGRRATTALALVAIPLGGLLAASVGATAGLSAVALVLIVSGVGFGLLNAPLVDHLSSVFPGRIRGDVLGLHNLVFFTGGALGSAVASVVVGAAEDPTGGLRALTSGLLAVGVAGAVPLLRGRTRVGGA